MISSALVLRDKISGIQKSGAESGKFRIRVIHVANRRDHLIKENGYLNMKRAGFVFSKLIIIYYIVNLPCL